METCLNLKIKKAAVASLLVLAVGAGAGIGLPKLGAAETAVSPAKPGTMYTVDPGNAGASDENPGTAEKPLKTLAKALSLVKGGETIELANGNYPALSISTKFPDWVTIRARAGHAPALTDGADLSGASHVRIEKMKLTWLPGAEGKGNFFYIKDSSDIEILDCEIYDDAAKNSWKGVAVWAAQSDRLTIRGGKYHHVQMGISFNACKQVMADGIDIGPWNHEDGARMMNCDGLTIQNCHITQEASRGKDRSGHVDGIQIIRGNWNVTIRNNRIHNVPQGIGGFSDDFGKKWTKPRQGFRFEGNLLYDIAAGTTITLYAAENPVFINNTLPQGIINIADGSPTTGAVVKNNIFRSLKYRPDAVKELDYNIWLDKPQGAAKPGPHDLVEVDPGFKNAPPVFFLTPWGKEKEMTRTRFLLGNGKVEVGDILQIANPDARLFLYSDGVARKVIKVEGGFFEVDKPIEEDPGRALQIHNWKKNDKNFVFDFRLRPDSPAVDSADGSVGRGKDMDGHDVYDAAEVANKGPEGQLALDRGAFEFVQVPDK